jgi:hypothetical protein
MQINIVKRGTAYDVIGYRHSGNGNDALYGSFDSLAAACDSLDRLKPTAYWNKESEEADQ